MRLALAIGLAVLPLVASGQEKALPGYFVMAVFEVSTAQIVAQSCPSLSVDPIRAARRTEEILGRLTRDGFTPENIQSRMADPAEVIGGLQEDFMRRHLLSEGAPAEDVCTAGRNEIADGSGIGILLLEVAE